MCFIDEYKEVTGVSFDYETFFQDYKIAQGGSFFGICANVQWCTRLLDKNDWKNVKDRFDKQIDDVFLLRCYYVQLEFVLSMLHSRSPYPYLQAFLRRTGLKKKKP